MQEETHERVFRYRMSEWWSIGMVVGAISYALLLIVCALVIYVDLHSAVSPAEARRSILKFIPTMIFWIVMSTCFILSTIRSKLEVQRGSVSIRSDRLVATDWRGQERELPWSSVTGMLIIGTSTPSVTLRTVTGSYQVSRWLPDTQPIIDAAIAGAGLIKVKDNWAWTTYKRPDSGTTVSG